MASWFKYYGMGSNEDLTILFLDVGGRCIDRVERKMKATAVWIPPNGENLSFNVDGSTLGYPRMAGMGGVLRNSEGRIPCLFSSFLGIFDALSAERVILFLISCRWLITRFQLLVIQKLQYLGLMVMDFEILIS